MYSPDEFMIFRPNVIAQKIQGFIKKVVSHYMFWFMDIPSLKGIDLFSDQVMLKFKQLSGVS